MMNKSSLEGEINQSHSPKLNKSTLPRAVNKNRVSMIIQDQSERKLEDLTPKEVLIEIQKSIKHGKEIKFRNFGLRNSAIIQLQEIEKKEREVKKKNHMMSVDIARKFLREKRAKKEYEDNIFDHLDKSLSVAISLDAQFLA